MGEKFWTRREGGAKKCGRVGKGGGGQFWTRCKIWTLSIFFFKVPKTQFFSCFVFWALLIFVVKNFGRVVKARGAKNFGRVI